MGTRGVPASYGGFETFAEELGCRLAARGHDVTVYGRSHVVDADRRAHRGMRLRVLPAIRHKYLDTVSHTALSVLDGLARRFDIVLICNVANAPFALVPRLTGAKVVLNVDGLEWERRKWNRLGRCVLPCVRLAGAQAAGRPRLRCPSDRPRGTGSATGDRPSTSRTATTRDGSRRARRWHGSGSSRVATSSSSAGSSPRTTPQPCSTPIARRVASPGWASRS